MKQIDVNNGRYVALVDDDLYEELSKYRWYVAGSRKSYACRQFQKNRIKHYVYMHRSIMNPPEGMLVDHINGDTLDNRRENLRLCTTAENARNSKISRRNTSGAKGVHHYKSRNQWTARITLDRKDYNLGYFDTIEEAIAARKAAEIIYHGAFARG